MLLCERCPDNPDCGFCVYELRSGRMAQKVIPPRPITLIHLTSGKKTYAELRAVSRLAIGVYTQEEWQEGRYEVELAADFRIIGNSVKGVADTRYFVIDIETVLRRDDVLERLLLEEFNSWHLSHELEPISILAQFDDRDDERRVLIKQELRKLAILRQLEEIFMLIWENDSIRSLGDATVESFAEHELQRIVKQALNLNAPVREQLISHERHQIYDVHALPLPDDTCGIVIINVTEAVAAERERQSQEWELYRNVLSLVTQDKLVLLRDSELFELIRRGEKHFSLDIERPEDLSVLRSNIRSALAHFSLPSASLLHYIVAVNEAASNTLKHGQGGSIDFYLSSEEQLGRAVIYDRGGGILLQELPKITLMNGYSTVHSLGAGFHVMLQYTHKLYLNSSTFGTKIVLEYNLSENNV